MRDASRSDQNHNRARKALLPLLPRTAEDLESARNIIELGYPAAEPVFGDMIHWMRVAESSVAVAFAEFFARLGEPAVAAVAKGLSREDCWIRHRVLCHILPEWSPEIVGQLTNVLTMIATQPDAYDNDIVAVLLLAKHRLTEVGWLKQWVEFKRERWAARNQLLTQAEDQLNV